MFKSKKKSNKKKRETEGQTTFLSSTSLLARSRCFVLGRTPGEMKSRQAAAGRRIMLRRAGLVCLGNRLRACRVTQYQSIVKTEEEEK